MTVKMKELKDEKFYEFKESEMRKIPLAGSKHRLNSILKLLTKRKSSGKVLEVGFGATYLLEKLAENKYEAFGIDISRKNVKIRQNELRQKGLNSKIVLKHGNVTNMPFKNNFFDAVIACEVLEHLDDADLHKALNEIHRVLSTNGIFIATTPNEEDLKKGEIMCPYCHRQFHRWGHKQSFSLEKIKDLFAKYFRVIYGKKADFIWADVPSLPHFLYRKIWRIKKNALVVIGKK